MNSFQCWNWPLFLIYYSLISSLRNFLITSKRSCSFQLLALAFTIKFFRKDIGSSSIYSKNTLGVVMNFFCLLFSLIIIYMMNTFLWSFGTSAKSNSFLSFGLHRLPKAASSFMLLSLLLSKLLSSPLLLSLVLILRLDWLRFQLLVFFYLPLSLFENPWITFSGINFFFWIC